jgi:pimeloyl-ACP methyl ester carboxylesterase
MLSDYARALAFFGCWSLGRHRPFRDRQVVLGIDDRSLVVRCTEPVSPPTIELPLVVFIHGMSLHGERDPRQDAVCEALAAVGFRVLSPRIDAIADLRFDPSTVGDIERVLLAAADDPSLSPNGRLAVVSVSFSAAATLMASARPRLRDRVAAALVLGGYCDVRTCVDELMTTATDDYGRLIALMNFLRFAGESTPDLEVALRAMCADNVAGRGFASREERLIGLRPAEANRLRGLLEDPASRRALLARASQTTPDLWEWLDLLPSIAAIHFPVAIVHGAADPVIAPSQARALASEFARWRTPHRLCVTPWIDHGTRRGLFDEGFAVIDVLRAFSFFLQAARTVAA